MATEIEFNVWPIVPPDAVAEDAWKLRMVYFDKDGQPAASCQPTIEMLKDGIVALEGSKNGN